MKIKRMEFLNKLMQVLPGLTARTLGDGIRSFTLKNGFVSAFGDDVLCRVPFELHGMDCEVPADVLVDLLKKMTEEEIEFEKTNEAVIIKGKRKMAKIKITLTVDEDTDDGFTDVEWSEIPSDLMKAISVVSVCAYRGDGEFILGCVHFTSDWVEACDNYQLARYEVATGLDVPMVVRAQSLAHVTKAKVVEFGVSKSWMCFRDETGLETCSRKYQESYPDYSFLLEGGGESAVFPKGVEKAVGKAEIFSKENAADNSIRVELAEGKLVISGRGDVGLYREKSPIDYKGPEISFLIAPKMLTMLASKSNQCEIGNGWLRVNGESFAFISRIES